MYQPYLLEALLLPLFKKKNEGIKIAHTQVQFLIR